MSSKLSACPISGLEWFKVTKGILNLECSNERAIKHVIIIYNDINHLLDIICLYMHIISYNVHK